MEGTAIAAGGSASFLATALARGFDARLRHDTTRHENTKRRIDMEPEPEVSALVAAAVIGIVVAVAILGPIALVMLLGRVYRDIGERRRARRRRHLVAAGGYRR